MSGSSSVSQGGRRSLQSAVRNHLLSSWRAAPSAAGTPGRWEDPGPGTREPCFRGSPGKGQLERLRWCCSVAHSSLTLCDPMSCNTPGCLSFTISLSLLRLMFRVCDAIQLFHPLLPAFPPAFNLSQHQALFPRPC